MKEYQKIEQKMIRFHQFSKLLKNIENIFLKFRIAKLKGY